MFLQLVPYFDDGTKQESFLNRSKKD